MREVKEIIKWLRELAFGCQCEPADDTIRVYVGMLSRINMPKAQWQEFQRRALLRHKWPKCLPSIAALAAISDEIIAEYMPTDEPGKLPEPKPGEEWIRDAKGRLVEIRRK